MFRKVLRASSKFNILSILFKAGIFNKTLTWCCRSLRSFPTIRWVYIFYHRFHSYIKEWICDWNVRVTGNIHAEPRYVIYAPASGLALELTLDNSSGLSSHSQDKKEEAAVLSGTCMLLRWGTDTYQKHLVRIFPGDRTPARVCIVVLHTSSAAGVISTAQDKTQTNRA